MAATNYNSKKHANILFLLLLLLLLFISKTHPTDSVVAAAAGGSPVVDHDRSVLSAVHVHDEEYTGELFQVADRTTKYWQVTGQGHVYVNVHVHGDGDGDGDGRVSRRKLGPFQVCLACRCCVTVSDPTTCSNMPCCFGIECQLPNKPFGVCAFVPKTCNCTSCASP